jgi:POT family proton-dependent oligopeptide transporter
LCLSPVGLSSMTKLAPRGRVGQMMGVWFIAAALGNLVAGLAAAHLEVLSPSTLFWYVAWFATIAGGIALLASPIMNRLSAGAE